MLGGENARRRSRRLEEESGWLLPARSKEASIVRACPHWFITLYSGNKLRVITKDQWRSKELRRGRRTQSFLLANIGIL
jgi:hypothetical protein